MKKIINNDIAFFFIVPILVVSGFSLSPALRSRFLSKYISAFFASSSDSWSQDSTRFFIFLSGTSGPEVGGTGGFVLAFSTTAFSGTTGADLSRSSWNKSDLRGRPRERLRWFRSREPEKIGIFKKIAYNFFRENECKYHNFVEIQQLNCPEKYFVPWMGPNLRFARNWIICHLLQREFLTAWKK